MQQQAEARGLPPMPFVPEPLRGKALSGSFYPVAAVLSNTEVLGVLNPGEHGSTFGGNDLAAAAALARPGDTVLLAPAAASKDMFVSYARRGDAYATQVRALGQT